jgi:hypothetical protein
VTQRHDIASFERRHAVVLVGVAPPDPGPGAEQRVEAVDRRHQQRLLAACRPEHRAQHDAVADPAAVVAGEQGVGQRRQQQVGGGRETAQQAGGFERKLGPGHAADQVLGQPGRCHLFEPGAQLRGRLGVDEVRAQLAVEQPLPGGIHRHRLGQQFVHLQHVHLAFLQRGGEGVVVIARLADPQHVVEQQFVAVGRSQALLRQAGAAHQHLAQAADFGVQTRGHGIAFVLSGIG